MRLLEQMPDDFTCTVKLFLWLVGGILIVFPQNPTIWARSPTCISMQRPCIQTMIYSIPSLKLLKPRKAPVNMFSISAPTSSSLHSSSFPQCCFPPLGSWEPLGTQILSPLKHGVLQLIFLHFLGTDRHFHWEPRSRLIITHLMANSNKHFLTLSSPASPAEATQPTGVTCRNFQATNWLQFPQNPSGLCCSCVSLFLPIEAP